MRSMIVDHRKLLSIDLVPSLCYPFSTRRSWRTEFSAALINSAKQTVLFQIRHHHPKAAPNGNGSLSKPPLNACQQSGMPVAILGGRWREGLI